MKDPITQERLKELLSYNKKTGTFTWKVKTRRKPAKSIAGGETSTTGRWQISVDGRSYLANRLAWIYVNGAMPEKYLRHRDKNLANNAITNLYEIGQG